MKTWSSVLLVVLLCLGFSVAVFAQDEPTIAGLIQASAEAEDEFTILAQALEASDLLDSLDDTEASFTLFAPSDSAFEAYLDEQGLNLEALLEDETLEDKLLYHLAEGEISSADLEDGMEIETLSGAVIVLSIDDVGISLNASVRVLETDIEASNGVIYLIDRVLEAPSGEACIVSTADADTVQVRVGPGENRGVVAFLPANVEFEVLGQANDNDGNVWFKLDKEEATPRRSNAEAWVAAADVESSGNCDNVVDVNAPPVIPIVGQPTANPDGSGEEEAPAATNIQPNAGSWTVTWSSTTNVTCGGETVATPTADIFGYTVDRGAYLITLNSPDYAFLFFTPMQANGNGTYQSPSATTLVYVTNTGQFEGKVYIDSVVTANQMIGRFVARWDNCSATFNFTANHQ
jgi:uncharacterized surface protein with fasciclin (FAS1) repeats